MRNILLFIAAIFYLLALFLAPFFGPIFAFIGYVERERAADVQLQPQPVIYQQIIDKALGNNRYVEVDNLLPCFGDQVIDYVGKAKKRVVYLPVYPEHEENEPEADQIRLIAKLWETETNDDVYSTFERPVLGLVDKNQTALPALLNFQLPSDVRQVLGESYPGIDVDQCQLLVVNGRLPSKRRAALLTYGGMVAFACGCLAWAGMLCSSQGRQLLFPRKQAKSEICVTGLDPTF